MSYTHTSDLQLQLVFVTPLRVPIAIFSNVIGKSIICVGHHANKKHTVPKTLCWESLAMPSRLEIRMQ